VIQCRYLTQERNVQQKKHVYSQILTLYTFSIFNIKHLKGKEGGKEGWREGRKERRREGGREKQSEG
jgi:hypothetical protein